MNLGFEGEYPVANISISFATWNMIQLRVLMLVRIQVLFLFLLKESIRKKVVVIYSWNEASAWTIEYSTIKYYLPLYNLQLYFILARSKFVM